MSAVAKTIVMRPDNNSALTWCYLHSLIRLTFPIQILYLKLYLAILVSTGSETFYLKVENRFYSGVSLYLASFVTTYHSIGNVLSCFYNPFYIRFASWNTSGRCIAGKSEPGGLREMRQFPGHESAAQTETRDAVFPKSASAGVSFILHPLFLSFSLSLFPSLSSFLERI